MMKIKNLKKFEKIKKTLTLILCAVTVAVPSFADAPQADVRVNYATGEVTAYGNIGAENAGKKASVQILNPGKTPESITVGNPATYGALAYIGDANVAADGSYESPPMEIPKETGINSVYKLRVGAPDGEVYETDFSLSGVLQFSDDFSGDMSFWDTNYAQMRIVDNSDALTSDSENGSCAAVIAGQTTRWSDFMLMFNFTPVIPTRNVGGFYTFSVRRADNAYLNIMVRAGENYGLRYTREGQGETVISGANYRFEYGETYQIAVAAAGTSVKVYVKGGGDGGYIEAGQITYSGTQSGAIQLGGYNAKASFDNVKVYNTAPPAYYYEKKAVKLKINETKTFAPINQTGQTLTNLQYSSSNTAVATVAQNGAVSGVSAGRVVITATASGPSGEIYEDKFDLVCYQPVTGVGFNTYSVTMYAGDTLNINGILIPGNASNKRLIWSVSNPNILEIHGDFYTTRGISAKAAGTARVNIRTVEGNKTSYLTVYVLPRPGVADAAFERSGAPKPLLSDFFGICAYDALEMTRNTTNKQAITDRENLTRGFLTDAGFKHIRYLLGYFDWELGTYAGVNPNNAKFTLSDMVTNSNIMGAPLSIASSHLDPASKTVEMARQLRELTDLPIYIEVGNEDYDPQFMQYTPTAASYAAKVRAVYEGIHELGIENVKVGAVIIGYSAELNYKSGVSQNPAADAATVRIAEWNDAVRAVGGYYDAVILHSYSWTGFEQAKSDDFMNSSARMAASQTNSIGKMSATFPGKEFWFTEYGDLPDLYTLSNGTYIWYPQSESERTRLQYMKSVGNAVGYAAGLLNYLDTPVVTKAAYHYFNDPQGFGAVQNSGGNFTKLPPYYMLKEIGAVLGENTFYYPLKRQNGANDGSFSDPDGDTVTYSRVNGWGFGDENGARKAIFTNQSNRPVNITLPNMKFRPYWSYGSDDPYPDFAKMNGKLSYTDLPSVIPEPEEISAQYNRVLTLPPYSAVAADVTEAAVVENIICDDGGGVLNVRAEIAGTDAFTGAADAFCAFYDGGRLVGVTKKAFTMQPGAFSVEFDGVGNLPTFDEIKVFLWDENMSPLNVVQ